jgi:hypothetical protein
MLRATFYLAVSLGLAGLASTPSAFSSDDTEGLSNFEVERVIQRNMPGLKSCFELAKTPVGTTDGKLLLEFKVGMDGKVHGLRIQSKTIRETDFLRCMERKVTEWAFPLPRGGMDVEVQYPLHFRLRPQAVANTRSP